MRVARGFWVAAPGCGEIREEPLRDPVDGDVVVRALYSGVSRGTESLVFRGRVPAAERQRMRAPFQAGDFPAPVKYGYASVGRVESGPPNLEGTVVFALFPHQTEYVVPAGAVHVVPDGVPPGRAVLAANTETALNVVWDAEPYVIEGPRRLTVIGAGAVGCLVAYLASRTIACDVELVDVNPHRAAIARGLGVRFALPSTAAMDVGVVVHASGSASGLELALRLAGFEATIVEASWYGDQIVPLALGGEFHSRRLTITSSQVGAVARSRRARCDPAGRMRLALDVLKDPALDTLITGESTFDELPRIMPRLAAAAGDTLCHRIRYV
ncbi:MAG TPA: zinc-binding alcohol dehydrogenase [Vicinamibacterales bacterium]